MHQNVKKVHQHPLTVLETFHMVCPGSSLLFQFPFNGITNCTHLGIGFSVTDDEIFADGVLNLTKIYTYDLMSLLLLDSFNYQLPLFLQC